MLVERIGPSQLAEMAAQGAQLEGRVPVADFPRLEAQTAPASVGTLEVQIGFGLDPGEHPLVHITVRGKVALVCQRCLSAVDWPVDLDAELTAVPDEATAQELADPFDSVLLEPGGVLALRDAVEDEVLALLPLSPRHADRECAVESAMEPPPQPDIQRPFADLAALMGGRRKADE